MFYARIALLSLACLQLVACAESDAPASAEAAPSAHVAVLDSYLAVQDALASDDLARTQTASAALAASVTDALNATSGLEGLHTAAATLAAAEDLAAARTAFYPLSQAMITWLGERGNPAKNPLGLAYCPMAREGRGAYWLQPVGAVRNPYYGAEMLACGTVEQQLTSGGKPGPLKH